MNANETKTECVANAFETLNNINVNGHTEKKNGMTYLSWAWAWQEIKMKFPNAFYTIYENDKGWFYHTDDSTCWVKTGVTINGLEHIEYLPVMDFRNKSIPADEVTSFDVNKAIQRSLTKACARHGLGLYIYAGEDLPEEERIENAKKNEEMRQMSREQIKKKTIIDKIHKLQDEAVKMGAENMLAETVEQMNLVGALENFDDKNLIKIGTVMKNKLDILKGGNKDA